MQHSQKEKEKTPLVVELQPARCYAAQSHIIPQAHERLESV
jgi:hypothetical protein